MGLSIREATTSDASALNELSRQLGYPMTEEQTGKNLEAILASDNEKVFIAADNDKVVAWIHVFHSIRLESGSFSELGGLVVDEGYRNKGIGKKLVNRTIEWSRERDIPILRLRSNTIRKDAHRLYLRIGFKEIKEQKVFDLIL
jgi:GNAT superfamily N-acetyltransferase